MKVTTQVEVNRLGQNQLLAFYTEIGKATVGEREFEILRSMSGLQFGLYEHTEEGLVIHTVNMNPVIEAALNAIIEAKP